jgi:hypothetical protein
MRQQSSQLSICEWYRILRQYRHWTRLQAIWYAIWLAR